MVPLVQQKKAPYNTKTNKKNKKNNNKNQEKNPHYT